MHTEYEEERENITAINSDEDSPDSDDSETEIERHFTETVDGGLSNSQKSYHSVYSKIKPKQSFALHKSVTRSTVHSFRT